MRDPATAVPFDAWFDAPERLAEDPVDFLWTVTRDYYVKRLGGFGPARDGEPRECRLGPDGSVLESNYRQAVAALERFDLVLICEWLRLPSYRSAVARRLFGGDEPLEFPELNSTRANRPYELRDHLTPEQRRRIEASNHWDRQLYAFGRTLSAQKLRLE